MGIGVITGIIGLLLANQDRKLYHSTPELYSSSSYNTSNGGRTCCIIGLIIGGIILILFCSLVIWNFVHTITKTV